MSKSDEFNKDILTRYIGPDKIVKAPIGFTEKTMTRINMEKSPSVRRNFFLSDYKIPLISIVITAALLIFAVITPTTGTDLVLNSILKPFTGLTALLPKIDFEKFKGVTINGWWIYLTLGIFMLSVFDRVLNLIFHREKK